MTSGLKLKTIGLNEFAGYLGVAFAGIITAYMAMAYGPREGLFIFGSSIIVLAVIRTIVWVQDALPWAYVVPALA